MGGHRKEVFLFVFVVLGLVGSDVGKDVKTNNWGRGDRGTGDNIGGTVRDIEKRKILNVVKGRPDRSRR